MEERDQLLRECTALLRELANHPYACSLLTKTRDYLKMAIAYKANRFKRTESLLMSERQNVSERTS